MDLALEQGEGAGCRCDAMRTEICMDFLLYTLPHQNTAAILSAGWRAGCSGRLCNKGELCAVLLGRDTSTYPTLPQNGREWCCAGANAVLASLALLCQKRVVMVIGLGLLPLFFCGRWLTSPDLHSWMWVCLECGS